MRKFKVTQEGELLTYLFEVMSDTKKTRVRQFLKYGGVNVNGKPVRQFNHLLKPGDKVGVQTVKPEPKPEPGLGVRILYEDEHLFAVDKPARLLTVATEKITGRDVLFAVNLYAGGGLKKNVYIVHRLDRDVSGVLVIARSYEIKAALQAQWEESRKTYYAIVEGVPARESGTVESYLKETKTLRVASGPERQGAKHAATKYRVIRRAGEFSMLEVELVTGRKHQIRVHLADLGHPIAGDRDYGSRTPFYRRVALHAFRLELQHPVLRQPMIFESPLPPQFPAFLRAVEK